MGNHDAAPIQAPPTGEERRVRSRGKLAHFWNLFFTLLRKAGGHAHSFYGAVGIFLLAGAFLAFLGTIGFTQIAEVVKKGVTQPYDVAILQWIHSHHTPGLTKFMIELTPLGTGGVVIVVVGVAAMFLWHTEHKHSARLLLVSTIGGIILNNGLKLLFHRERPSVFEWGTSAASSSFPSGHAMSATVVYGTVAYLVARLQRHYVSRVLTMLAAAILILGICFTRLYLGVHYPSDVVGGIVVGVAWASFCMATLEATLALARWRSASVAIEEKQAPKDTAAGAAA